MAISYTYHGANRAKDGSGKSANGLGPNIGNAVAVANAAASAALAEGWYRIKATDASLLQFGASVTNGDDGEIWDAGEKEARYIPAGYKIGVSAG
jgi:hypothetical protein